MVWVEWTLRVAVLLLLLGGCRADPPVEATSPEPAPQSAPSPAEAVPSTTSISPWQVAPTPSPEPVGQKPDMLILVLDTTGPRAIQEAMPRTQAFVDSSRSYAHAIAPSNSTMETVAGVLTGTWMSNARLWDSGFVTLSEALRGQGYTTYIGSANPVLDHPFYVRGFDTHHVRMQDIQRDFPDQGLTERFLENWGRMESPKMAWLQLAACHDYRIAGKNYIDDGPPDTEEELVEAWDAYLLDCAATDALIPSLLAANPRGVTVVTADHGELFGQLGTYMLPAQAQHGHGVSNSPMEIHVPLAIRGPGFAPGVEEQAVSLLDIRTTLLAIAGLEAPGGDLRTGKDLRPAVSASCDVYDDQTSHFSTWVRDDGSQLVRSSGLGDIPELLEWTPPGSPGLHTAWTERGRTGLEPLQEQLLYADALLPCVDDRDLCSQHPELSSLGYIDCP